VRDVSIGDILTALGRYRPVVFTVAAILAVLAILPKPEGVASLGGGAGVIRTPTEVTASTGRSATSTTSVEAGPVAIDGASASADASASFSPSTTSFSSGGTTSDAFGPSDTTPTTFQPSSSDTISSTDTTSGAPTSTGPLRIATKTWASRTSGTPLAKEGVPAGTLPVGVRVQDDKLSFVRQSGDELVLRLVEDPNGLRDGTISVQACPITTSSWNDGEAIAIGEISYDTGNCAQGVRGGNGVWQFDLGKYPARAGGNGFALVPGEDAGLDFQVCFKLS
jgi:hypothetical protein